MSRLKTKKPVLTMIYVPVVNSDNQPLMPTFIWKAKKWIKRRTATPFWNKGVFCIRLNVKTTEYKQAVCIGIDPGSKKEGFTVKSESHTYINIQTDAITHVKAALKARQLMWHDRRCRKTPCRIPQRQNTHCGLVPSIRARWQWKLRIINWLKRLFPISNYAVEDIKAKSKSQKKWDIVFTPLQLGKHWFYSQLSNLTLKQGWDTKGLRDELRLRKTSNKLSMSFYAHCVDSWVLANYVVGGHTAPDNISVLYIKPLRFHRRQLHRLQPCKGGKRPCYGGTRSLGLKRGSLVTHIKYGLTYIGGTSKNRITLHNMRGERVSRFTKPEDCHFLTYNSWTFNWT